MIEVGNLAFQRKKMGRRDGILLVEIIVASTVLIAIMVFVTTLCLKVQSTWKDVREQRQVMAELSRHLDRLTMLPEDELENALDSIALSESIEDALRNPELSGRIYKDSIGKCVELTMQWEKNGLPDRSVSLSAWNLGEQVVEAVDE